MTGMVTQNNINLCAMPGAKKQTNSTQGAQVLKHREAVQGEGFGPHVH